MEPLYGLTGRTVDRLGQLLGDYGEAGGRARSGTPARGMTWVKVTGAISGGWYPGVVSMDVNGTWVDLTAAVNVQSADGSALISGSRYLCTRTGDSSGGVAQFRTIRQFVPTSGVAGLVAAGNFVATISGGIGVGWENTGLTLAIPSPGKYLLGAYFRVAGSLGNGGAGSWSYANAYGAITDGSGNVWGGKPWTILTIVGPSNVNRSLQTRAGFVLPYVFAITTTPTLYLSISLETSLDHAAGENWTGFTAFQYNGSGPDLVNWCQLAYMRIGD